MNIVIVGAGEVGRHLAANLSSQKHQIHIIEADERLAGELDDQFDAHVIHGSGTSVSQLAEARAAEADLFVALTSDDSANLVAASIAKSMGAQRVIARVHGAIHREEWIFDFRSHFGIDHIFSTERLAAIELAKFVRNPERLEVEELARGRIELQVVRALPESAMIGKPLKELGLPSRIRVASIQRQAPGSDNLVTIIPRGEDAIEALDLVTLFGEPTKLGDIVAKFDPEAAPDDDANVVIFGGDEYGFALAQMLEGRKLRVRIIERDEKLCRRLSETLQRTVVIHGDATSLQQLKEEQVGKADFFIAVCRDDEDNVMACLQAKNLGTRYCLSIIHRADYADIITQHSERLGMLAAVSPRVASSRDLLRFVSPDRAHTMMTLSGGVEVIEATMPKESSLAGTKIAEIEWPEDSSLMALMHGGEAHVPSGDDVIEPGATLYAIVTRESRKRVVKLLSK